MENSSYMEIVLEQHFQLWCKKYRIIYVLHANENRELLNQISDKKCSLVDWILVDSAMGGSGKGFGWTRFALRPIKSKHGWLLIGGINPANAYEALAILKPNGIDVGSGICGSDSIQKDQSHISSFMNAGWLLLVTYSPNFVICKNGKFKV